MIAFAINVRAWTKRLYLIVSKLYCAKISSKLIDLGNLNRVPLGGEKVSLLSIRLQNSPHFCVFKYARAVKQKVWNGD